MALKAIRSRPGDWAAASAKESTGGQTVWSARVRSGYGVQQGEHQKPWGIGQSLRRWRWIGQRLPVTHRARNLPLQERRRETYPRVFDALRRLCLAHTNALSFLPERLRNLLAHLLQGEAHVINHVRSNPHETRKSSAIMPAIERATETVGDAQAPEPPVC
jgi:hypothetical protein